MISINSRAAGLIGGPSWGIYTPRNPIPSQIWKTMPAFKSANFQERQQTAAEARKALLEKFKARPAPDDPAVLEREAKRRAIVAARAARAAEREARRQAEAAEKARREAEERVALEARVKAEEEAREKARIAEAAALEIKRREEAELAALLEAEKKAERDARYAARKGRKAQRKSELRGYR